METLKHLKQLTFIGLLVTLLLPLSSWSQNERIKPPKRISKVKSADIFVNKSFELYEKVFVYDSLTVTGSEIPTELEDELANSAKEDFDQLVEVTPDVVDDIGEAPIFRQAKAILNLNKAKNALAFCGTTIKNYFLGKD